MKVKVTKKESNTIELRDTIYKITLYSKDSAELKCATDLVRENINHYLVFTVDTAYADYTDDIIVLSDSMSYPNVFSDRPEGTEVVEVVRGFNAKTTEADMLEIIMKSIIQSRHIYPEVAINWEMYQAGNEMPDTKPAETEEETTAPVNDPMISFINPSSVLTNTAQDASKDIVELVCMSRYGALNYKKLNEFRKRITGVIADAYAKELNAVSIPYGFVKVVPNLEETKYSENKIRTLAYYTMALIFASGGDYDTDVEASFVKPHLFPTYGLAAMPNSHIIGMGK